MVAQIHRFESTGSGIDLAQLRSEIGDPAAVINDSAGGQVTEVTAEDTALEDLKDSMTRRGFTFLSTNPSDTATDEFESGLPSLLFGSQYQYAEQLPETTETGDGYVQAFRFSISAVPAGTYRINWTLEFKGSSSNREVGVRIQLNDSAVISDLLINEAILDSAYKQFAGFTRQVLAASAHTLDFDIRRVAAQPVTALIQNIRADIWRVA